MLALAAVAALSAGSIWAGERPAPRAVAAVGAAPGATAAAAPAPASTPPAAGAASPGSSTAATPVHPYVPDDGYVGELNEFTQLASEIVRRDSPGTLVTTNFGRYPFDEDAIRDGRAFFEALPGLDLVSINVYPDANPGVITALPRIVHEFQALGKPVAVSEVGLCTDHFHPHHQAFYLKTFLLFLRLASPAGIYVYEVQDDPARSEISACEARFGLKAADGSTRPAYESFVEALRIDPTVGVVTHLYTSGASSLDLAALKANLDGLAKEGLEHLSLAPDWWAIVHAEGAAVVWDEERFQLLVEALVYARSRGVAVRLHTAPPWRDGMTKDGYRGVVEAYYERIASLPNLHAVQVFNEPNLFRFTDGGPLPQDVRP